MRWASWLFLWIQNAQKLTFLSTSGYYEPDVLPFAFINTHPIFINYVTSNLKCAQSKKANPHCIMFPFIHSAEFTVFSFYYPHIDNESFIVLLMYSTRSAKLTSILSTLGPPFVFLSLCANSFVQEDRVSSVQLVWK